LAIAGKSWQGHLGEYSTIASSPRMRAFYEDLWQVAGDRGWRAGGLLEINGAPAAFAYCLNYHERVQFLKTGYDPGYGDYSPGMLLVQFLMREACETGNEEFDFYGSDVPWKLHWTHLSRGHVRWLAYNRRVRPLAAYAIRFRIARQMMRIPGLRQLRKALAHKPSRPGAAGS